MLQVGAGIIIEDPQGRVLLQLRADNHCWGYCGGSMDLDERVEDTAKRELFEETGLITEKLELFAVFSGPEYHYIYPNGDEVSNVDNVFLRRRCPARKPVPTHSKLLMQWAKQKPDISAEEFLNEVQT